MKSRLKYAVKATVIALALLPLLSWGEDFKVLEANAVESPSNVKKGDKLKRGTRVVLGAGGVLFLLQRGDCGVHLLIAGVQETRLEMAEKCESTARLVDTRNRIHNGETLAENIMFTGDDKADSPGPNYFLDAIGEVKSKPVQNVNLNGSYRIRQKSNGRYVDAHESSDRDHKLVTRTRQNNTTQVWVLKRVGKNTYTIQQKSNWRYVDAHVNKQKDHAVVTRLAQNNNTQRWVLTHSGENTYTIQQKSNGRYLDAHEGSNNDYLLVTRPRQGNNTQRWIIQK